jgi:hypothetical protein
MEYQSGVSPFIVEMPLDKNTITYQKQVRIRILRASPKSERAECHCSTYQDLFLLSSCGLSSVESLVFNVYFVSPFTVLDGFFYPIVVHWENSMESQSEFRDCKW